jgi:hypothetical protein
VKALQGARLILSGTAHFLKCRIKTHKMVQWWISFTNDLPASDSSRIKRSVRLALAGGARHVHHTRDSSPRARKHVSPLRGGQRAKHVRHFYRTNKAGRAVSSATYTLRATGTPIQLVHQMFERAPPATSRSPSRSRRSRAPSHPAVPSVTFDFVRRSNTSPSVQQRYLRAYARDRKQAREKKVVYLREKGKKYVREYEVGYQMVRFPTRHNITHGTTRHLIVNYVQNHACA